MKRYRAAAVVLFFITAQFAALALPAQAAVSSWQKGADVSPASPDDFGSASFDQSLQNLKATGANAVAFVIPYYQSNTGSTDIGPGYNTPTDASLASAIDYAHSIGLSVTLKLHDDPYSGEWRAYINPGDRNSWFANYGNVLLHLAGIAQAHHAEMIVIGTELVSMASSQENSSNTQNWLNLIGKVRAVYSGKLTYDANSTNNNNDPFENEKGSIGFWSALDYAGLSAYYNLNTSSNDVQSLEQQWDYWNNNDLKQFAQWAGKPVLFMEVGYRSVDQAHTEPWNWQLSGNYNATEQSNDYQALMSYWNNYPYLAGVYWWSWDSNPNAGGQGDEGYTVQNKPAQQVLTQWFTNPPNPGTGGSGSMPTIMSNASANPASPAQGSQTTITASVQNSGGALSNGIIDIEIYNQSGSQVFQKYFSGQNISNGQTLSYNATWAAAAPGAYTIAVGVFNSDWSKNYSWNGKAASITTTAASGSGGSGSGTGSGQAVDIWWPINGSSVIGVQPFKAMLENTDVSQYQMFWQVDGGQLNQMGNSTQDYPHKEAEVDVSGWSWSANNQYTINFVSKDSGGNILGQKSAVITVTH